MSYSIVKPSGVLLKVASRSLRCLSYSHVAKDAATSANTTEKFVNGSTNANYIPKSSTKTRPANPINYENELIRKVFDDETFWQNFNRSNSADQRSKSGLFQNPYLTSPQGLHKFCDVSIAKSQKIVDQLITDKSNVGLKNFILNLDKLSDTLCRVIDLAEFTRAAHPDPSYVQAAQEVHEKMFEFMNVLNTNVEMYDILNSILNQKSKELGLTEEEIQVGKILLADFEKSGTNMEPGARRNFIDLSQNIAVFGQQFLNGVDTPRYQEIEINSEQLNQIGDSSLIKEIKSLQSRFSSLMSKNYKIPLWGSLPYSILRSCKDAKLRERVWVGLHSTTDKQISLLETLLKYRAVLAHTMGKETFSAYQLEGKMAKTPELVYNFLENLAKETAVLSIKELNSLANLKKQELNQQDLELEPEDIAEYLKPWDRDYYGYKLTIQKRSSNHEQISSYLSLGVVMQGLSNVLNKLYGVQLIPEKSINGETWDKGIRRLNVISETEGLLGVIYCDFFYRRGKALNPAHFTICCSRNIYPDETLKDLELFQNSKNLKTGEVFQLPVISVICNFENNSTIDKCLLSLQEVETLFHEMGHAMHSMFGRTKLQNLSGTRCATDFVELPSILMEFFAKDERVLTTFARHYFTDEPIPINLLRSYQKESNFLKHTESFAQLKMAMLDQELHSNYVFDPAFNSSKVYHRLERSLKIFRDDKSNWQGKFGHLFGYGAMYYTYLFDRAIATKVWEHLFAKDPLNRVNGEKFKEKVLKFGGSKDPWKCIGDVLDQPELSTGDLKAMEIIGETKLHE